MSMSAERQEPLRVEVLGPLRAWVGPRELDLGAPLQQAAFAVLAFRVGRAASRSELIDAIWGDDPPPSAENGVHTYVKGLRRVLEPARTPRARGHLLISTTAGYVLRLGSGRLDADLFDQHVREGRRLRAAGDLAGVVRLADAALALWRAAPLSGIPGPFAEIERTRLSELRLSLVEERAEVLLGLGRHGEVAADLPTIVSQHPFREHLRSLLMLALYRSGRQADALAAYQDARRLLTQELGIEPSHDIRRLHEQILSGDQALDPAPITTIGDERPHHGLRLAPAQLPHDVAGFTDREAELARLRALLPAGDKAQGGRGMAISAIDGAAGVGKTAVAVHFGHQVAGLFPDGQLYIDLRGFDPREPALPPDEALGQLLRALQIDPRQIPSDLSGQAGMYRSVLAGKRMLVVLDNAATADQVRPLLPGSSTCFVIVTSRKRLRSLVARDGARCVTLDALSPAEAVELMMPIIGSDRLAAEPGPAAGLARLCGYLPLALRIAAEHVAARPYLTLAELYSRLAVERDRLDILETDDEAAAVRAALSWSYRSLPPQSARMFRLLGLHAGTDISGSAAAVLAGTDMAGARRLLETLADAHLLEEVGPDRFRFHELVRVYASEHAAEEEAPADRDAGIRRLLSWYLHTADAADSVLDPRRPRVPLDTPDTTVRPLTFASHDEALQWCEGERANLVAAARQAAAIEDHKTAWQLPLALFGYFYLRKPWNDWIAADQVGLSSARLLSDQFGEAAILTSLGIAYYDLRRFEEAIQCLERSLLLWHAVGFPQGEGVTLDPLGAAYRDTGRFDDAIDCFGRALLLWRAVGDSWGEGITLHNLGDTYRELQRFDEAIEHFRKSQSVRREIGDQWGLAWTLHDLGSAYAGLGQYDNALGCYRQALAIRREVGDQHGEARTLRRLGQVYRATGQPGMAGNMWRQAQTIFEDLGDPRAEQIRADLEKLTAE
jgi:DNA-binding SARP family transcriptional activator